MNRQSDAVAVRGPVLERARGALLSRPVLAVLTLGVLAAAAEKVPALRLFGAPPETSAESVVAPRNRVAPAVITGETCAPPSTRRRQTSTAL